MGTMGTMGELPLQQVGREAAEVADGRRGWRLAATCPWLPGGDCPGSGGLGRRAHGVSSGSKQWDLAPGRAATEVPWDWVAALWHGPCDRPGSAAQGNAPHGSAPVLLPAPRTPQLVPLGRATYLPLPLH